MLICMIFVALIVDILNLHSLCSLEHAYLNARRKYVVCKTLLECI